MRTVEIPHAFHGTEPVHLTADFEARRFETALPAVGACTCHVVARVVARYQHKRCQQDAVPSVDAQLGQNVFEPGPALHSSYIHIVPACQTKRCLQRGIHHIRRMFRAVPEQNKRISVCRIALRQDARKFPQALRIRRKRTAEHQLAEICSVRLNFLLYPVVFIPIQQMRDRDSHVLIPLSGHILKSLSETGNHFTFAQ